MTNSPVGPITRTVRVQSSAERAFKVFTEGIGTWWPLETHSIAVDQGLEQKAETLRLEGREGGRIEEVLQDGTTRGWGGVDVWEPPSRVVFWWKPNELPTPPTKVEVRFTAEGDGTQVELDQRGWDRLGEVAEELRSLYSAEGGWTMVLDRFASAAAGSP
jgi:Activator of Hsp90 ATPase homolog 1-like protein